MGKDRFQAGEPCWIDCGTDLERGPAFYAALFGWTTASMGPDAGGYTMASIDGAQVAGFGPQQSPGPPTWSVYFSTDDATKTAQLVREHGGAVVVEPMAVLEEGTLAVFTDPAGVAFSVWQPQNHRGFAAEGPGTFCWAELTTTDVPGAIAFYEAVLGFTTKRLPDVEYTELHVGGTPVGGILPKPAEMPPEVPPSWGVYFAVEDADATLERIGELGGRTLAGPMDIEPGRFAACVDALGAHFSIIALRAA